MDFASNNNYPSGEVVIINDRPYRIGEMINKGADGRIYAAYCDGGIDSAVVKFWTCLYEDELWHSALKEIEAMQRLSHCENITRLLGYCVIKRQNDVMEIYMLMPMLKSCEQIALSGELDIKAVLQLAEDICTALEAIDKMGWVHCDIKPSNILYNGEKWLLGDFGCIQAKGRCIRSGSSAYRSPEANRGQGVDIRSDIYSLGIMLYRLFSGDKLPFCSKGCRQMAENEVEYAIKRRMSGEPIDPIEGIDEEINRLLALMCEFEPKKRVRSPKKLRNILKKCRIKNIYNNVIFADKG